MGFGDHAISKPAADRVGEDSLDFCAKLLLEFALEE